MANSSQFITLNTGAKMPIIGLGTWKSESNEVGKAVEYALLECDYRHIDCAAIYRNESEIGQSLNKIFTNGEVKREDIFITSKLWNVSHAQKDVEIACKKTLQDLQIKYLDLYLMHWGIAEKWPDEKVKPHGTGTIDKNGVLITPKVSVRETWEAMEELVRGGLVKAIGLANFTGPMIVDLLSYANIKPAMNQIELHPYNQQSPLVQFCQNQSIAVTAYSPLGTPGNIKDRPAEPILLNDKTILSVAERHQKSPAQVLIRLGIQRRTVVIPKSTMPKNIKSNIDVFDFELTKEEMDTIATLDKRHRFVDPFGWWGIPYFD